jgi:acetyl/propionyl-CoA carboxylase alpha subunit/acetyl-CoA carboxylase carboxyltransferase component
MLPTKLLIANRGEIAIRLIRAAAELGIKTVAIHTDDDTASLHTRKADEVHSIGGHGPRGYLDGDKIIAVAKAAGCDAIHPGYGFLSENAAFAATCIGAGLNFVGPRPEILELFGDKAQARQQAKQAGLPLLPGSEKALSVAEVRDFFATLGAGAAIAIKAIAGGGGRGIRIVHSLAEVDEAYARCASEAQAAFGNGDVYVEQFLPQARHIEIQIIGDGSGAVTHLGERDCSIQRRHQKIVEITPAPNFPVKLRNRIIKAAVDLASSVKYNNIGTFEFLVDASDLNDDSQFAFMEANPRLQVEHTITEEISGVDLVETQLRLAGGAMLADLNINGDGSINRHASAMQVRINMESVNADGSTAPAGGTLSAFEMPSGKGIRVDSYGYVGYRSNPAFDSLLAKLITCRAQGSFDELVAKTYRALGECRIDGVATNIEFLQDLLLAPAFVAGGFTTSFVDEWASQRASDAKHPRRYFEHAKAGEAAAHSVRQATPEGCVAVVAPMLGSVVAVAVQAGDAVAPGQLLAVIEAMKMEHEVRATAHAIVRDVLSTAGAPVLLDDPMFFVEETGATDATAQAVTAIDLDHVRHDLGEVLERHRRALDAARPDAVAKRHAKGQRTARENVADLCDPGTFVEYGALAIANQRSRRSVEELIEKSPADGIVTGIGSINGEMFGDPISRCAVLAYDYTVFAGTQGNRNHLKTDRLVHIAMEGKLPLVLFAEGGGGRPGEDSGDYGDTFAIFAQLSGLVPMVGIVAGRCYAGNAALLGVCDVIIATQDSNIGMGGPAMIEGGGLGVYRPEEIGPIDVQTRNGVVDIAVKDEAEAVAVAKKYLGFFQGCVDDWEIHDQRELRHVVPENRLRAYDIRRVIELIADVDSALELRRDFGTTIITTLARIEGRPIGIIANNPAVLGGAIDSDGSDKAARFMQLCDAFDLPILNLCDTPGIMVGPEVEKTALVRHSSRMFLVGTNITVPNFTIIVRKTYGLGGIAMTGGALRYNTFTVGWPTGEFGPMGLEGAVRLGYRNELAAIEDAVERRKYFDEMVENQYQRGKALKLANAFGIDDCIDPADSRFWIANILSSLRPPAPRDGKKRPFIDAW